MDIRTLDGIVVHLDQQAYIDDTGDYYLAHGTDEAGNDYEVRWTVIASDPASVEDESEMCNWSDYVISKL